MEKQETLLQHIGELEEYIDILESMGEFEQGEKFISYTADEEFKEILDKGLTKDQKDRVEQIKKENQSLHSMEDILSMFDESDKDEEK